MSKSQAIILFFLRMILLGVGVAIAGISGAILYLNPALPSVETIRQIPLQTPLRVYSKSGKLIAEFGEKKRTPVAIKDVPAPLINAFLAAEDARFFTHAGVDIKSLSRAFGELATSGAIHSGGSTITMQLAKNYFLSSERTFMRKGKEVLLALKLERELSKQEILELYLNKIYLGNRAYGIVAAAYVYYGKPLQDLSIAECAMLAGLPKAPSANNPINNPVRARERRNWILGRMLELQMISQESYDEAIKTSAETRAHNVEAEVNASYVAEMARQFTYDRFGEQAYENGYRVYTTIDEHLQQAANNALQKGLLEYDQRHGYHGAEFHVSIEGLGSTAGREKLIKELKKRPLRGPLVATGVLEVNDKTATLIDNETQIYTLSFENARWARPVLASGGLGKTPTKLTDVLKVGDIVRIQNVDEKWRLAQVPGAQSALVSLDPNNGALLALVGGFDFTLSKFNRATQGGRQPGSSFKPFIYTAALAKGMTPASIVNDAPFIYEDPWTKQVWRPQNHSNEYQGPMRLREALYKSKNMVSIRVLEQIGIDYTLDYLKKFSFDPGALPKHLSLALGTAEVSPLQMATGYAVFANGGYKIEPWWVSRIENIKGEVIYAANPAAACLPPCTGVTTAETEAAKALADTPPDATEQSAPLQDANLHDAVHFHQAERVEEPRIIWLINSMMSDVIKRGTATKALVLKREDIAGKTGTTNDQKDAWFSGFNPNMVASVWLGYDNPTNLGGTEFGGTAALPIWIDYMREALKDKSDVVVPAPDGLVSVRIDPNTAMLAMPGQPDAIFETFQKEKVPEAAMAPSIVPGSNEELAIPEQLF